MMASPKLNLSSLTKKLLLISSLSLVILIAAFTVWTINTSSSVLKNCASGNNSRSTLSSLIVKAASGSQVGADRSGLLAFYKGWALDITKEKSPSMQVSVAVVVDSLNTLEAELASNPLAGLMNADLAQRITSLKSAYSNLLTKADSLNNNPNVSAYIDVETSIVELTTEQVNLELAPTLYGTPLDKFSLAVTKLKLKYAIARRDDLAKTTFTDVVAASINKAALGVGEATTALGDICR